MSRCLTLGLLARVRRLRELAGAAALLDDDVDLALLDHGLDRRRHVTQRADEVARMGAHGVVVLGRQHHLRRAVRPAALAEELGRLVAGALRDRLVRLAKGELVEGNAVVFHGRIG